jgi:hypothetical protein
VKFNSVVTILFLTAATLFGCEKTDSQLDASTDLGVVDVRTSASCEDSGSDVPDSGVAIDADVPELNGCSR